MTEQSDYANPGDTPNELNLDDPAFGKALVEDEIGEEQISDLPQSVTESYGTGVHDASGLASRGGRTAERRMGAFNEAGAILTGGDIDANFEQANAVGDEAVGGTAPTPDQDIVDDLGAAVGLEMDDRAFLRTNDILNGRDAAQAEVGVT